MKYYLSKDFRMTILGGKCLIGNVANGSFIVLSKEGHALIEKIMQGEACNVADLSDNLKEMLTVALECDILCGTKDESEGIPVRVNSAYIHVTNMCNLHCVGCYSFDNKRNVEKDMSLECVKAILRKLKSGGVSTVFISGGEPLLRGDIVDILRYAKEEVGIEHLVMGTNGTNLTEELAQEISLYIDTLNVSVDGFYDEEKYRVRDKGSFEVAVRAIKIAKKWMRNVVMLPTLTMHNYMFIPQYNTLAKELGVNLAFSILTCDARQGVLGSYVIDEKCFVQVLEYMDSFEFQIEDVPMDMNNISFKNGCGMGRTAISVDAVGDVYPCHMLQVEEFRMGNLLSHSLEEIMTDKMAMQIAENTVDNIDDCKECSFRYICGGGCRARSYFGYNSLKQRDVYCEGYKQFFRRIADYLASLDE